MSASRIDDDIYEGTGFDLRWLLTDKDGFALTNAVTLGYELKVFDLSNGMEEVFSVAPGTSVTGLLFDVPIKVGWDVNDVGYNFSLPIDPPNWTVAQKGGHSYRFEVRVDTALLAGKVPAVAVIGVHSMESV